MVCGMMSPTWRKAGVENVDCSPPDVLPSLTNVSHLLCACIAVGFSLSAAKSSVCTGWIVPLVDGERCVDAEEITSSDPMVLVKLLASAKAPALQQRLAVESGNQERSVCVTTRVLYQRSPMRRLPPTSTAGSRCSTPCDLSAWGVVADASSGRRAATRMRAPSSSAAAVVETIMSR